MTWDRAAEKEVIAGRDGRLERLFLRTTPRYSWLFKSTPSLLSTGTGLSSPLARSAESQLRRCNPIVESDDRP